METKEKSTIDIESILSTGYGLMPQVIARDNWLSTGAKALYAYLTSFAGAGGTCFPSRDIMVYELDINKDSFTKYLNELKDSGYIKVHMNRKDGKRYNNIYEIVFNKKYIEMCISNRCDKQDKKKSKQRPKKQDIEKQDIVFSDSISNSLKSISINNNSSEISKYIDKENPPNILQAFSTLYQKNVGLVNGITAEWLIEMSETIDVKLFKRAIEIATDKGKCSLGYIKGIIKQWLDVNIKTYDQLKAYELQKKSQKEVKPDVRERKGIIETESSNDDTESEEYRRLLAECRRLSGE